MTGGEAYRAKLITDDALNAAISAYLADPSAPAVLEIGKGASTSPPPSWRTSGRRRNWRWRMRHQPGGGMR